MGRRGSKVLFDHLSFPQKMGMEKGKQMFVLNTFPSLLFVIAPPWSFSRTLLHCAKFLICLDK